MSVGLIFNINIQITQITPQQIYIRYTVYKEKKRVTNFFIIESQLITDELI